MDLDDRPRLRVLLDHFALMEDDREVLAGGACVAGGAAPGGLRDDLGLRRLRRDRRMGRGQPRLPAPLPALSPRCPRRALAAHPVEPDGRGIPSRRSSVGHGAPAGCAVARGARRHDLARQPRPRRRARGAASRLGLRDAGAAGDRPGGGGRGWQRTGDDPDAPRSAFGQGAALRFPRHDRRGRLQRQDRPGDPRRRRPLLSRREGQPARPDV